MRWISARIRTSTTSTPTSKVGLSGRRLKRVAGLCCFMVEIWDPEGEALYARLRDRFANQTAWTTPGVWSANPAERRHAQFHIPSEHPTITTPLSISLGGTFAITWHRGYLYDFVETGDALVEACIQFLDDFLAERIRLAVSVRGGLVTGGGPVWDADRPTWESADEVLEIRSWRGSRDETIVP